MASYGDYNLNSLVKRVGVADGIYAFTAHFTTANGAAPTIDTAKTRGVVSIARTGEGVVRVTLPFALRNVSVQLSVAGRPAGAVDQALEWSHTEGTAVVDITAKIASTGAADDQPNTVIHARIEGRNG